MQYTIYDRDVFNNSGEFILSGPHYYTLLKICVKYSSYFSLYPCHFGGTLDEELGRWRIAPTLAKANETTWLLFYKACDETYKLLKRITTSLFDREDSGSKYSNDMTFYRDDGTVFMETLVHEGECSIYPREDENVDDLLSFGNWIFINEFGDLDAPAAEHQLLPPQRTDVIEDAFYILLQEIRNNPEDYLSSATIEKLDQLICAYRPLGLPIENARLAPPISALPHWYIAFKVFVLGKYNCSTAAQVTEAICSDGIDGHLGFLRFYELLDEYLQNICIPVNQG